MKFSKLEIKEIGKAWIAVAIIFSIAYTGLSSKLFLALPIALLTAGVGFLLHELSHKYVAQRYRCWAEFRANNQALILGLLVSFFGFIILAPGGVYIRGATKQQHGKIALAGPMSNVIIGLAFLGLTFLSTNNIWVLICGYGLRINALLAVFNMIPFPPFDGFSVWQWNKVAYVVGVVLAGGLFIL